MVMIISSHRFLFGCFFFKKRGGVFSGSPQPQGKVHRCELAQWPQHGCACPPRFLFCTVGWCSPRTPRGSVCRGRDWRQSFGSYTGDCRFFLMPSKGIKKNVWTIYCLYHFLLNEGILTFKKKEYIQALWESRWIVWLSAGEAWKCRPVGAGALQVPLGSPCSSLVRVLLTGTPCLLEPLRAAFVPLPSHLMTCPWRALQPLQPSAHHPFSPGCKSVSLSCLSCLPAFGASYTWNLSRIMWD